MAHKRAIPCTYTFGREKEMSVPRTEDQTVLISEKENGIEDQTTPLKGVFGPR